MQYRQFTGSSEASRSCIGIFSPALPAKSEKGSAEPGILTLRSTERNVFMDAQTILQAANALQGELVRYRRQLHTIPSIIPRFDLTSPCFLSALLPLPMPPSAGWRSIGNRCPRKKSVPAFLQIRISFCTMGYFPARAARYSSAMWAATAPSATAVTT